MQLCFAVSSTPGTLKHRFPFGQCYSLLFGKWSQNGLPTSSVQCRHVGSQARLLKKQKAELSAWPGTTYVQHGDGNKKLLFSHLLCFCSLSLVPPRRKLISHFAFIFLPHIPVAGKVLMRISSPKHPATVIPLHSAGFSLQSASRLSFTTSSFLAYLQHATEQNRGWILLQAKELGLPEVVALWVYSLHHRILPDFYEKKKTKINNPQKTHTKEQPPGFTFLYIHRTVESCISYIFRH